MSHKIIIIAAVACLAAATAPLYRTTKDGIDLPWPYNNTLLVGESMMPGDTLASSTSYITLQPDGNVVLYRKNPPGTVLWASNTAGKCPKNLTLQTNGNLVLTACDGSVLWQSQTSNVALAVLQDDCNFVLYRQAPLAQAQWATGSSVCVVGHVVPHSHDDVGWLLTPQQYYDGCDPTNPTTKGVRGIITSVVNALVADKTKKFSQVEMYFFDQWWKEQNETKRQQVRELVANGQLEFINGGWSMHDEACVHYLSGINNMAIGAQYIRDQINSTVLNIGWHIDPFGHASATPRLMAQMGFNAFYFWRTDHEQSQFMQQTKTLETVWRSSPSMGSSVDMFTSIMYDSYCSGCNSNSCPSNFCCFDCVTSEEEAENLRRAHKQRMYHSLSLNDSYIEAKKGHLSIKDIASGYADYVKGRAGNFRTQYTMIPFGCDFNFQYAPDNYAIMDEVMKEINNDPTYGLQLIYSTPGQYINTVNALNYRWPVNYYDYFLDSDDGHSYWSGYLTSRAAYKGWERTLTTSTLQSFFQIQSGVAGTQQAYDALQGVRVLNEALGVAQHHDSITGTEKVAVRNNYQLMLANGTAAATSAIAMIVANLTNAKGSVTTCPLANLSVCLATEGLTSQGSTVPVYVYNPLPRARSFHVMTPVSTPSVTMIDDSGKQQNCQVISTWNLQLTADNTSPNTGKRQPYTLACEVILPALGLASFTIKALGGPTPHLATEETVRLDGTSDITLSNDVYSVTIDGTTGRVSGVYNNITKKSLPLDQNFYYYCPNEGDATSGQASGAYIFRTCDPNEKPVAFATQFTNVTVVRGALWDEVRQTVNSASNIQQTIRVLKGNVPVIFFQFGLGEISLADGPKEVVMRFDTNIASNSVWYADSQGLEVERRVRNSRPNYPYTVTEPVAGNFFPSNVFTYLANTDYSQNLGVIGDRSRAAASLQDGSIEMLVHRRLLHDDGRGVGEALNEDTRIISENAVIVNDGDFNLTLRVVQQVLQNPCAVFYGTTGDIASAPPQLSSNVNLPPGVALLSREFQPDGNLVVRLQNIYAIGDGAHAAPVSVDLMSVFPQGTKAFGSVVEMDINAARRLSDVSRLSWMTDGDQGSHRTKLGGPLQGTSVTLAPMEIRTFLLTP